MKIILFLFALRVANCGVAFADSYKPYPLELAPEEEIKCSWSTMRMKEYDNCYKRKKFFEKMTPKEKNQYNEEVRERKLKDLEDRVRGIERDL